MRRFFKKMMLLPLAAAAILWSGMDASAAVISGTVNSSTYASNYITDTSEGYNSPYLGFSNTEQYTVDNATFATRAAFGIRHGGNAEKNADVWLKGTNTYNVMMYFGARAGEATNGVGGNATVKIGGDPSYSNTFSTRVLFGGEGGYADDHRDRQAISQNSSKVGKSTVRFVCGDHTFEHGRTDTKYGAYFSAMGRSDFFREVYHQLSLYRNDAAMTAQVLSEIEGKKFNIACKTEGTDVTFDRCSNATFNSLAYFGGAYDLTTYNSVSTSSDDKDIVMGGTNNILFKDCSNTEFYGRTFFGGAESTTKVSFEGCSSATFGGKDVFWSGASEYAQFKGYALKDLSEYMASGNIFIGDDWNTYRGQDLPYVFFGGSTLDDEQTIDVYNVSRTLWGTESTQYMSLGDERQEAVATVDIKECATVQINTTAFFGGADERNMAGDQVKIADDGTKESRFFYGACTGKPGEALLRNDGGQCTVNLSQGGTLGIGVANENQVLSTTFDDAGNKQSYIRNRYEQVRLIGTNATFNANGGNLRFDWKKHNQSELESGDYSYTYLVNGLVQGQDYSAEEGGLYVINDTATAKTLQTDSATLLDTGMMIYRNINIGGDTKINVSNYFGLLDGENKKEYYTSTAMVATGSGAEYSDLELNLSDKSLDGSSDNTLDTKGGSLTVSQTKYSHLLYDLYVEDVHDDSAELGNAVTSNRARLHIVTKSADEVKLEGNLGNNKDTIFDIIKNGQSGDPIYDAMEDILDMENMEEACKAFDNLIGAQYGNLANNQLRRLTMANHLLANQMNSFDPCRPSSYKPNCGCGSCGSCNTCSSCGEENSCGCGTCGCNPNCYWNVWGSFDGSRDKTNMNDFISGYTSDYYGGIVGVDRACCDGSLLGAFFSFGKGSLYADSNIGANSCEYYDCESCSTASNTTGGYTDIDSNDFGLGLYGKWLACCFGGYWSGIANVGLSSYDAERSVYGNKFKGKFNSVLPSAYLERGWVCYACRCLSFNPYFGIQMAYYHSDSFSEESEAGNAEPRYGLDVDDINMTSLRSTVGLRIAYDINGCGRTLGTLRLSGAWIHEFMDEYAIFSTHPQYETSYSPAPWHTIHSDHTGRDWAVIGAGLNLNLTQRISLIGDYGCFFNEYTTVHSGMATLRIAF